MSDRAGMLERVRTEVGAVRDPELQQPLAQLGMVRQVRLDWRHRPQIEIALTTPGCPMTEQIRTEVTAAVGRVPGAAPATVRFTTMSEQQRQAINLSPSQPSPVLGGGPAAEIYAVASGKGGVGKSSVAANLAVALSAAGKSVGLIDADVWGYSVPQLFGICRAPVAMNGHMLPVQAHGVSLMSLGFFVTDNEPVVWRGPMLHKALTQFVSETHWGELDVLILDLPPGTGDVTLSVLELLPDAALLAVTTPQPAARSVASRVGAMAREVSMPVAGVIENMSELICPSCSESTALFGSGGGEQLARELGTSLLGRIPLDLELRLAGDEGVPAVLRYPDSAAARALRQLSAAVRPVRRSLAGRSLGLEPVPR